MIRPYKNEDKNELVNLLRLNTPRYFAEAEERDFTEYLEKYKEDYFVIEADGRIVGAGGINYFPAEELARLSWDMVHPELHGKGIGTKLTQYRIALLKSNPAIAHVVVRTSQHTYRFYEKSGFELEKTQKDFWAKGFDLYQMRMPLQTKPIITKITQ